jgi:hypothetical protein
MWVRPDSTTDAQSFKAVRTGDTETLSRLIDQGVKLDTPALLKTAVESDQADIVDLLLRHGADPNGWITDRFSMNPTASPVYIAASKGNRKILQLLRDHGVKMELEASIDTSQISTPLLAAVYYHQLGAVRLLIEYGADVNFVSRRNSTALMLAVRYSGGQEQIELIKLLLARGANPDHADDEGNTARSVAYSGKLNDVSLLIAAAKPPTKSQQPPPGGPEEIENIRMIVLIKTLCDAKLRGYREETAAAYQHWRQPRAAWIDAYEKSPTFQAGLDASNKQRGEANGLSPQQEQNQMKQLDDTCHGALLDEFVKVSGAAPNPALATPQRTWEHYLASLRKGDRAAAVACLISTARDKFKPVLQRMTTAQLHAMADAVQSFALTGTKFGNFAEAIVAMKGGAGGLVYFSNVNGEWRISEM